MPKATAAGDTKLITIPTSVVGDITKKMQEKSVVQALAQQTPQLFTDAKHIFFTEEPEAEYVGEGEAKSSAKWGFEPKAGKIHKIQTTIRMTDEVRWADTDNRLRIWEAISESLSGSMARAIDYGMIHAINPLTQEVLESLRADALAYTANQVTATSDIQADIDALPDTVLENYDVTGIALDRMYANELRKLRNSDGVRLYPEVGMNLDLGNLEGITCVTSGAVSGKRLAATPTGIKAIIGAWNLIKWGMVRNFAIEEILYGDPDGLGDLKRYNQVAYRVEAVFSWVNLDPKGFAVLKDAGASGASTQSKAAAK